MLWIPGRAQSGGADDLDAKVELLARTLAWRVSVLPLVAEIRQSGLVVEIALRSDPPGSALARQVVLAARRRGAAIRRSGDVVILAAAPSSSDTQIRRMVAILASSIAEVAVGRMQAAA